MKTHFVPVLALFFLIAFVVVMPQPALAHCDTTDGPVVSAARTALSNGDVTPVLKWIRKEYEPEIRSVFSRTLKARTASPEAKELADDYFFETLVRLHRAGEGEPYTGLRPADTVDPAVLGADKALEKGSVDELARSMAAGVEKEIRQRFAVALQARKSADESVDAGREYVETYVKLMHYLENLDRAAQGKTESEH